MDTPTHIMITKDYYQNMVEDFCSINDIKLNGKVGNHDKKISVKHAFMYSYALYRSNKVEDFQKYVGYSIALIRYIVERLDQEKVIDFIESKLYEVLYLAQHKHWTGERYFQTKDITEIFGVSRQFFKRQREQHKFESIPFINAFVYAESDVIRYAERTGKDYNQLFKEWIESEEKGDSN